MKLFNAPRRKSTTRSAKSPKVFTFGDPEPVMEGRDILDMFESWWNGRWHETPISLAGLAKSYRANPHHSSAIQLKRNILVSCYLPHKAFKKQDFSRWALDFLLFGNSYLERVDNWLGEPLQLKPSPAKYTRRAKDDIYFYVPDGHEAQEYPDGKIHHLMEPDVNQELYGVPEYLAALQAAWLNESATLFRRKYYTNGSHAGYILYVTDTLHEETDIDTLRKELKESKGPGNFRNLLLFAPGGKEKGVQILPVAEVQAKDEFFNIKNVSRDDVLAGHRVPPQLMGMVPANVGGFGDVEKAAQVFARNEIEPLQQRMMEVNDWLGIEVIQFKPYTVDIKASAPDE